ncbi:helix-turn-helix transcriptional regulator [Candidatus Daviesbacteria bacterium]|nr:helix-turn-helix transcriptional regulator [Candidatus Daviesbacteria bacterium]
MSKQKQFSKDEPLTPAIFHILLALSIKKLHGYEIMKKVSEDSKGKINLGPGTLYGAIKRLVEEGLIIEVRPSFAKATEDRRRYYQLTKKGRKFLNLELERFSQALKVAKAFNIFPKIELNLAL